MTKFRRRTSGLSFRIICTTIILLLLFGIVQSIMGYLQFTESLTREYNDSAFRTAETAATLINGNHIADYLETGGESDEYRLMAHRLDTLCQKQNVTLIYVISVNTDGYGDFTNVISVQNVNSAYDPWPVGYQRETTNDEYRAIYRDIYENGLKRGTVERTDNLRGYEPHITSLIPVTDDAGKVTAILCVQRPMSELAGGRRRFMLRLLLATLLLILLSSVMSYFFLREHFVRPMKRVTKEAERFARENTRAPENTLVNISTISEIETLARSLDQMESDMLLHIEELTAMTADRERISTELSVAKGIQAAILPNEFPPFPWKKEFDIFATMSPAREIGGDFYDFFLIDDDHLGLVIADVAGKGIPAALFMMVAKLLIKLRTYSGGSLGDMLSDVNGTLCERNQAELFVTVWFAVLTISTGEGFAVNAGHEHPAIRRADGAFELIKYRHSPPVATMDGIRYKEHAFKLNPGDMLYVYTDGVTEASNTDHELFGEERLTAALNRSYETDPKKLLHHVREEINEFVGDGEQFDDITMLGLYYKG
ncbi:MAG: SpoIIE family protein phosphatase [Lachnospiraceae bacterium]|nr:SpoIIE family protein phosphatase [Lachnospiraceae bacterium]